MFEVTDNFALAIRLKQVYIVNFDHSSVNLIRTKRGFDAHIRVSDGAGTTSSVPTKCYGNELTVWQNLPHELFWLRDALHTSDDLYYRGLARRFSLMTGMSELDFEARMVEFERTPMLMWETALKEFGGTYLGKARLKPRVTGHTKGISWIEVQAKVGMPHYDQPVTMAVRCFPSPVDENAWAMQVELPCHNTDIIRHNQKVTRDAIAQVEHRGIRIEDVVNGTRLSL
ncbi:hypothetical protein G3A43_06275 [Paraburkholderia aspalathi]|nr:hypothetical protein [Paraburkholderia aspalathi]MBK3779854.1 hypothetical protein [Paraburkholderia aspalathi]